MVGFVKLTNKIRQQTIELVLRKLSINPYRIKEKIWVVNRAMVIAICFL